MKLRRKACSLWAISWLGLLNCVYCDCSIKTLAAVLYGWIGCPYSVQKNKTVCISS
ncbi:hypothetical protein SLEP1_g48065 [Rubroshorea leprosula]|uniref:Uncharacterized protein n=1 Tax=Rubroshorea leprosula TaxID=152421 RepID=A0AAV5LUH9_9ROSI|nr:hypothetical protein SLEP1_g48065 [Rubroshorea leprosula]